MAVEGTRRNASPEPATVSADQLESATTLSNSVLQLPADILQTIFDSICASARDTLAHQRLLVTLSLVCKQWAILIRPHRKALILPTARSIESFNTHASALRASGVEFSHLTYARSRVQDHALAGLMFHLSPTLTSITMPVEYLNAQHFHNLVKSEACRLKSIHIVDPYYENAFGQEHEGSHKVEWWEHARTLYNLPTLVDLTISDLFLYDSEGFPNHNVITKSPIRRLHLHNIHFDGVESVVRFSGPLVPQVQHLDLTGFPGTYDNPAIVMKLCQLFGPHLLSLRMDRDSLKGIIHAEGLFALLPRLEQVELDGGHIINWRIGKDNMPRFVHLPQTLKHCSIGWMTWAQTGLLIQHLLDPAYLPKLVSPLRLSLYPGERRRYCQEIQDYEETSSLKEGHVRYVLFDVHWTLGTGS